MRSIQIKIECQRKSQFSMKDFTLFSLIIQNLTRLNNEMKKNYQDLISGVKITVRCKYKLRIGVKNSGEPGNRKETKILVLDHRKKLKKTDFYL